MWEDTAAAYHMAARKYCIYRIEDFNQEDMAWGGRFQDTIRKTGFNSPELDELYKEYPRYDIRIRILEMILNEIETIIPENLSSAYQMKEALSAAVQKATIHYGNGFAKATLNDIFKVCYEEKQNFYDYVNSIKQEELNNVDPLPYRRVLTYEETVKVKEKYETTWAKFINDDYSTSSEEVRCLEIKSFFDAVEPSKLIEILIKHGNNRVYMIDTYNLPPVSYIMDPSLLNLRAAAGEVLLCSDKMEWAIFKDHEGYLSICSRWLIQEIAGI